MSFAGKVWRLLVGIKDGLVLLFMLMFFAAIFAVLSARPSPGQVRDGALLLELDGFVVEERSEIDPFEALLSQTAPVGEYPVHELVHALEQAAGDERISAVVLDLSGFLGGGQVHLQAVGEAIDRVRAADKPVLTHAIGYGDDAMLLAAHASEVWVDPMGGAIIAGPGGSNLYYGDLLDKLNVNARVYRVGTYKAAVEPYLRNSMSEEARENYAALYGTLWEEWQANVKKARPALQIDEVTSDPVGWVEGSSGDLAKAALDAGMVDKLGGRVAFGKRVAEIAGTDEWDSTPGSFVSTDLATWLADNAPETPGKAIGIITIAGDIVDGDAGPATAGGDRIAALLDDALDDELAGLVVRVNSPGGSILASEVIRRAILRHKENEIPIAVSMANVAASGGYWVSTPADRIFAQPETVTGSIGVFAVIPTFEGAASEIGVNADGYRTTPLSGQPDLIDGFTPEIDAILQGSVTDSYADFIALVAGARNLTADQVDRIGQGRVWDGGTARQIGLVDQFGGIEDAVAWVAEKAELGEEYHVTRLGAQVDSYDSIIRQMVTSNAGETRAAHDLFAMVSQQQTRLAGRLIADVDRLTGTSGIQAYCMACPREPSASSDVLPVDGIAGSGWIARLGLLLGD